MSKWAIELNNLGLGGYAPAYYKATYPTYGNKNQAGTMSNIDMTNPSFLRSGPIIAALTSGTQSGNTTTLIKSILQTVPYNNETFACGGNKIYDLSATENQTVGIYPCTIDKAAVTGEDAEDVAYYAGNLYCTYNYTSASAGDIAFSSAGLGALDPDWGSTVPSGAGVLQNSASFMTPKQMCIGGNNVLYIANERYVASYDGVTLILQALDLPVGYIIQSLKWMNDRLYISAVKGGNFTAANYTANRIGSSVFIWDGTTDSWESEITIPGLVSALFVKNSVLYLWYQDISDSGACKIAYLSGTTLNELESYSGSLPNYYQVTEYKDFILWFSGSSIFAWGSGNGELPPRIFQFAAAAFSTSGALAAPFGTLMSASKLTSNFHVGSYSDTGTYNNQSSWKSLMFDITADREISRINMVRFNFEKLVTGGIVGEAKISWSLVNNKGATIYSDTISFTKLGGVSTALYKLNGLVAENFRIQLDWSNGQNTTNPILLKGIKVYGTAG